MPKVYSMTFIQPDGTPNRVEAPDGMSVLEIAHRNNFDLEGACEGAMACSTCHVIVDADWAGKLDSPSEEEEDMLDLAVGLTRTSRLGCQLTMNEAMDGLVVSIPSEHRNLLDD